MCNGRWVLTVSVAALEVMVSAGTGDDHRITGRIGRGNIIDGVSCIGSAGDFTAIFLPLVGKTGSGGRHGKGGICAGALDEAHRLGCNSRGRIYDQGGAFEVTAFRRFR